MFSPNFDLYEALELTSTASAAEITASYRRLAREHHPDKNPDNADSTEKMQQINEAHEILSNEERRAEYDNEGPSNSSGYYHEDDAQQYEFRFNTETMASIIERAIRREAREQQEAYRGFDPSRFFFFSSGSTEDPIEFEAEIERQKKLREERAEETEKVEREKKEKAESEKKKKAAREEEKRAMEEAKQEAKERLAKEEKDIQDQIWKDEEVTTEEAKRDTCLHTSFWPRIQGTAKFTCMGCNKKKSRAGFQCPHCELIHCQKCLDEFNANRRVGT
ncbi:hypothetical protein VTL71DRAFT_788 [Oculimacula yallundae]|uniref:J domain-containing protein n=1 Tax=Oculimacula yallundae TaxID=86028 RepID=A0ABR4D194_9HELO